METIIKNLYTVWLLIFIFMILYIIRVTFLFIRAFLRERNGTYVYQTNKFILVGKDLLYFGLALSYIFTYIMTD